MEKPDGLEATHSRKRSARISKGEPEITTVTGCNGRSRVGKAGTKRKQRKCSKATKTLKTPLLSRVSDTYKSY
jgi:hypothetical protein